MLLKRLRNLGVGSEISESAGRRNAALPPVEFHIPLF
jgi:hypothetical protein